MTRKNFGTLAASLLLALTLAACDPIPENTDINTPHEEITLTSPEETASKTKDEITPKEDTDPPEEITSDKTTDKSPDTINDRNTTTESEKKTEVTPEESILTAKTEFTSTATAADSSEKTSSVTAGENDNTKSDVQTADEPVYTNISAPVTEPAPPVTTTSGETDPPKTEPQTTTTVTEPPVTEPVVTAPPLTGGAYNQRYCTEAETEFAERVFELTNIERAKEGLPAFEKMDTLKNVALTRAWELTIEYRADHSRPDGSTCTGAFNENGIIYGGWAENIAAGQDTPEKVVEAWMNSPSHRAAILNEDYTYMGVGYYYIKDDYQSYYHFWTQEFYHY